MTVNRDLKKIIRARQAKTGESYTTARLHVMRERATLLNLPQPEAPGSSSENSHKTLPVEAIVLKMGPESARVRIEGEPGLTTFKSENLELAVPGCVVTLTINKRWTESGTAHASGRVEDPYVDLEKLQLAPLPLSGGHLIKLTANSDIPSSDPHDELWQIVTKRRWRAYEMHPITAGETPNESGESKAMVAAEHLDAGDVEDADAVMMALLNDDLRCLAAYAHWGDRYFEQSPEIAIHYYEVGTEIGEFLLPEDFDGILPWIESNNQPFLCCMFGYAKCLWRLGQAGSARSEFERLLALNLSDNQGARYCLEAINSTPSRLTL